MEGIDVFYVTVVFCFIFAVISAYLIYQYVQEERKVASKMRLKREFEMMDPSNYAREEARKRGAGKPPGSRPNGTAGSWVGKEAAVTKSGIPVLQMSEDGKLVPVTEEEMNQRAATVNSQRAGTVANSQRGASVENGLRGSTVPNSQQGAFLENGQREPTVANSQRGASVENGLRGSTVPNSQQGAFLENGQREPTAANNQRGGNGTLENGGMTGTEMAHSNSNGHHFNVGQKVAAGVAMATVAAAANKTKTQTQTHPARQHYKNDDDLRLELYNERYDETGIEPDVPRIVGPSTMVVAAATALKNRSAHHADAIQNNTSVFHVANESHHDAGVPQRSHRKKKVARLLQPIEGVADFDDYRNPSQDPRPPPPDPASYSIPTPVMENDRQRIMIDYKNRNGRSLPRVTMNSGMDF